LETNETYYGLPKNVKFCSKCVISNQRPSTVVEFKNIPSASKSTIIFDDENVCNACRYAEHKENVIDWKIREEELIELCNKHRSKDGSYDCIVPGSGGKDSVFSAHILKYKYKMNPLTVTWTPHIYTDVGWSNFQNWIHSGFDNILLSPNGKLHRLLTKLAFENLCHPFQPFIIGQKLIGPRYSALYDIPLIFYGENQAEYGNLIEENESPTMKSSFFMEEINLDSLYLGGVPVKQIFDQYGYSINDLNPYLPVNPEKLKKTGTQVHYLGYYLRWDPQECYYYSAENAGFQANKERTEGSYSKYDSIDDKMDPLHYYTMLIKFGIGRATKDAAQEIRNGKITREEGVALVHRYDNEFPKKHFKENLEYMDISEERFWEIIDKSRSPHLWKNENGTWVLMYKVQNL